jgi:hypothetical protein
MVVLAAAVLLCRKGGVIMNDEAEDRLGRVHREEGERIGARPPQLARALEQPTIPYTQLPPALPDSPLRAEWNYYRGIVGRLLAEGQEGKWLLIKNEEFVGIWDTEAEANAVRLERFLMQPVLLKQVLAREPVLRIGYNRLCRS